ncbi:hypothetical protein [Hydrogenophaga sp. IBVHS1]|uniref:hypothetical protein n=1 Tax=unclassified Hydrogenophaga TaxID=2610897 RepID=UPI0015C51E09|nr:hypothetical protein [Hydrogenophaga sp. IBVHS1]
MKSVLTIFGLTVLLQACAMGELAAPPAPCASTVPDCGPAKPLNTSVAQASRGQGAAFA